MGAALGWGALAASSLVFGALLGLARTWPARQVGIVLAFGAGALISAVSFDLGAFLDGIPVQTVLGIGLATGEGVQRRPARRDPRVEPARGDRLDHRAARLRHQ